MIYQGSKASIARHIIPIMEEFRPEGFDWVEPFVGGGNSIQHASGTRVGYDIDQDCIDALILIRDDLTEIPRDNTEYTSLHHVNKCQHRPRLAPFAKFAYSYSGVGWDSYRRCSSNRDYVAEAYRNAEKQSRLIQGVEFKCLPYTNIHPEPSLIYCDPPYYGAKGYSVNFDHGEFISWCEDRARGGSVVFVSEYSNIGGWDEVWRKDKLNGLNKRKNTEKLFKVNIA